MGPSRRRVQEPGEDVALLTSHSKATVSTDMQKGDAACSAAAGNPVGQGRKAAPHHLMDCSAVGVESSPGLSHPTADAAELSTAQILHSQGWGCLRGQHSPAPWDRQQSLPITQSSQLLPAAGLCYVQLRHFPSPMQGAKPCTRSWWSCRRGAQSAPTDLQQPCSKQHSHHPTAATVLDRTGNGALGAVHPSTLVLQSFPLL